MFYRKNGAVYLIFFVFLIFSSAYGKKIDKQKDIFNKFIANQSQKKGQKKSKKRAKKNLEEIVITASKYEKSTFEIPKGVTLVGKQEISEKNPRTVSEMLRSKPGIWIQKTGHLGGAPILRGFMGNRVIYLFDGIRRNTAGLFKGPNSFMQNIDALDVDRVEVIRGPGSVLYGSDAIGGIVNVISNEQPIFSKSFRPGGRMFARYATVDEERSERIEGYSAYKNVYLFMGGTFREIGLLKGGSGVGKQDPSQWREKNWDGQINVKLTKKQELEFFIQGFNRPSGRRFDKANKVQGSTRELYGLKYKGKRLGIFKEVKGTAYFHNQRRFRQKWGQVLPESQGKDTTYGMEVQAITNPFKNAKFVGGFHFHADDIESGNLQKGTQDPDVTWYNPAVFALLEWQILPRFRVEMGLRWDEFILKSTAPAFSQLAGSVQKAINAKELSLSDLELNDTTDSITGGVGMVFSINDWLNAVFHFGRAFRAPNKSDMLRFGQFTFGFNVPTTGIRPESSLSYEFGLRADHDDFAGAATFFYTTIEDAIISVPGTFAGKNYVDVNGNGVKDAGEDVFVKKNTSSPLEVWGVELEGKYYLPEKLTRSIIGNTAILAYGNFTWIYGRDRGIKEPLQRAFPANGLLGIRFTNTRERGAQKWWVACESWMVRAFSRIPSTRINRDAAYKLDPQNKKSPLLRAKGYIPGFTIFNIRGGFHFTKYTTFTIGLNNITNKRYRIKDSRIDAPGMNLVFSLEIKL